MIIKVVDSPAIPGGKGLVALDNAGEYLPMQVACTLEQEVGEEIRVQITFRVDGRKVRLASE